MDKDFSFYSPSKGEMNFSEVIEDIVEIMNEAPQESYEIVVGSDSHSNPKDKTFTRARVKEVADSLMDFVTAVIIHKVGKGGRYFWKRTKVGGSIYTLRQKIYKEAILSFELAKDLMEELEQRTLLDYNLEIHVDVGERGRTREMIDEVVGMIIGSGFAVKTKPEAYGASSVADKHA